MSSRQRRWSPLPGAPRVIARPNRARGRRIPSRAAWQYGGPRLRSPAPASPAASRLRGRVPLPPSRSSASTALRRADSCERPRRSSLRCSRAVSGSLHAPRRAPTRTRLDARQSDSPRSSPTDPVWPRPPEVHRFPIAAPAGARCAPGRLVRSSAACPGRTCEAIQSCRRRTRDVWDTAHRPDRSRQRRHEWRIRRVCQSDPGECSRPLRAARSDPVEICRRPAARRILPRAAVTEC